MPARDVSLLHRVRSVLRPLVPRRLRRPITRAAGRVVALVLRGTNVSCPCCSSSFRRFVSYPSLYCPRCGSYERHRALCLLLASEPQLLEPPLRLLHVAPDGSLAPKLRRPGVDYVSIDLDYPLAMHRMDVTRMSFPDESFDTAVCLHVFERVEQVDAALPELRRVLRPGGLLLLEVPAHLEEADGGVAAKLAGIDFDDTPRRLGREFGPDARRRHGLEEHAVLHLSEKIAG